MKNNTVAIDYLGCKLNQAEVESLALDFIHAGYSIVPFNQKADVYVLNSCTVTHVADRKTRQWLGRARRQNPLALIVVTGCYAEREPAVLKRIDNNIIVMGNDEKLNLVQSLVEQGYLEKSAQKEELVPGSAGKTRSLVWIQQGCSNRCSYCIVPLVRNAGFSRSSGEIIEEVKSRIDSGYLEIVLTGTEIGSFNSQGMDVANLVKMILEATLIKRLRLSSLQPHHIDEPLLDLWKDSRLCAHFHLSLQSGSDAILKSMNRKYDSDMFIDAVNKIRAYVPDAAITTDVIVGFPGETQEDFEETLDVCQKVGFARIHVFPYSPRPGTFASQMKDQISPQVKKLREAQMTELAKKQNRDFRKTYENRIMPVLWESYSKGLSSGLTPNYIRVYAYDDKPRDNTISDARILGLYKDGVAGEVVQE
jgi:threonylcarbamoyladenosine tRNA methylthiotransferase MtaB